MRLKRANYMMIAGEKTVIANNLTKVVPAVLSGKFTVLLLGKFVIPVIRVLP